MLTAHSGSDGLAENSFAFVKYFTEMDGVEAIELDVRKDNQRKLILAHDDWQEGQEYLLLETVFSFFKENHKQQKINCDLKISGIEEEVFALADAYQLSEQLILSGTVSLEWVNHYPKQIFYNLENLVAIEHLISATDEEFLHTVFQTLKENGVEVINLNYHLYQPLLKKLAQAYKIRFSLWTVNDPLLIQEFIAEEVYNVTSRIIEQYLTREDEPVEVFKS